MQTTFVETRPRAPGNSDVPLEWSLRDSAYGKGCVCVYEVRTEPMTRTVDKPEDCDLQRQQSPSVEIVGVPKFVSRAV